MRFWPEEYDGMSFEKHPRTLVIPQSNNAAAIRLSIAAAGIFIWILLCSHVIAEEPGKSALRAGKTARVKVVVEAQGTLQLKSAKKENESAPKPLPMKAIGTVTYDEVAVRTAK